MSNLFPELFPALTPLDITPLIGWLRSKTCEHDIFHEFAETGSHRFFGKGQDRDFLVCYDDIPEKLRQFVPQSEADPDYDESMCVVHDDSNPLGPADYLIATRNRTAEFEFATEKFCAIKNDPVVDDAVWQMLEDNKPLRIAVFRSLRRAFPNSTLNH